MQEFRIVLHSGTGVQVSDTTMFNSSIAAGYI